jgi:hypothetical protein
VRIDRKRARIEYRVAFTREEIEQLTAAARSHYDGTCRMVASQGWLRTANASILPEHGIEFWLNWTDFDILSKICESPLDSLTDKTRDAVRALFQQIRDDTHVANIRVAEDTHDITIGQHRGDVDRA